MDTRQALRELLELVVDADVVPSSSHNPVEWDTVMSAAIHNARAALAAKDKAERELVEALEYIAAPQYGVSSGTAWDQLVDVRKEARKALAKHAKE